MPERRPFTESDDGHLVEYIAINNPDAPGRNGNSLYKTLVENPKRWPWSNSHPWQSWRERYKKNPVWFDRKIRAYLKKQKEARAASSGPSDKIPNEAEGSNQAGERTAKAKGVGNGQAERKRTALNQQTSTSVDGRKPTADSVKISRDTGNASTDSGYASTTMKTPTESEKKQSGPALKRPSHKPAINGRHGRSGDNATPSSSRSQSTAKPPKPVSASGQGEANASETEESEAEEEDQGTAKECTEDDCMHELFGSFEEEEEEEDVAEPEDPPASSAPSSPSPERIYPDLRNVAPPDIAEQEGIFGITSSATPPQDPPLKTEKSRLLSSPPPSPPFRHPLRPLQSEKQLKRKAADDDPFIDDTPPSSPTPERYLATRRAPPVLNEGPFRNLYVQTRNPGEKECVADWPPNRKRKETEGPSRITESHAKSVTGRRIQQQVNAVASSSKVRLPPPTAVPSDSIGTALQKSSKLPVPMHKDAVSPKTQTTTVPDHSVRSRAVVTEQPPAKRQKLGHPPITHQEATHSLAPHPTSSPMTIISNTSQGNLRVNNEKPATRRVDLRESLKKRRIRAGKSSLLSSRGSTVSISNSISNRTNRRSSAVSSASRHRRQHISYDEDLEFISLFERELAELGEQYGFALGVVKKTYMQFGTLEKTSVALRALNAIMREVQDKLYEEMNNKDGDLIPEGVIPKDVSSRGKEKKGKGEGEGESGTSKRHRLSLTYKPLTTDVEDQSEYSPPSKTRAGRYTKLQKEGREEEALIAALGGRLTVHLRSESREGRVSSGRDDHHRATTIQRGMEPSSPLDLDRERSATPDEEDVAGPHETGGEEGHNEEDDDIELSIEHAGMDVSSDQYEVRDLTPEVEQVDDEELVLRAERKKLWSEVTLEYQDAFKKKQAGDAWRRESGDLFEERFSTLKEVQEIRKQEYYRTEAKKAGEGEEHRDG